MNIQNINIPNTIINNINYHTRPTVSKYKQANNKEQWKDIKGYEDMYQISCFGRVRSIDRYVKRNSGLLSVKEKILKCSMDGRGYLKVGLHKNGKRKNSKIHQLVAVAFLNHITCGFDLVINHIDFNKLNNHKDNLEIVTQRANANHKHLKDGKSSIYTGVDLKKSNNKWRAHIYFQGKCIYLGSYTDEYEAHLTYEKANKEIIELNQLTQTLKTKTIIIKGKGSRNIDSVITNGSSQFKFSFYDC